MFGDELVRTAWPSETRDGGAEHRGRPTPTRPRRPDCALVSRQLDPPTPPAPRVSVLHACKANFFGSLLTYFVRGV